MTVCVVLQENFLTLNSVCVRAYACSFHQLDLLPAYVSKVELRRRLLMALEEGAYELA